MFQDPDGTELKTVQDLLGRPAGMLLEVGCGDGRLTECLLHLSRTLIGLDPDPESIRKARRLEGSGTRFILGSGECIPLADGSMDTVVFSLSLHHHPDPVRALAEADRVLGETACILVLEPDPGCQVNMLFRIIHDEDDAYRRAGEAIRRCGWETAEEGSYQTIWRFDGFDEMVDHLFGCFDLKPDPAKVTRIKGFIGVRRTTDAPLDIENMTRYWLLRR